MQSKQDLLEELWSKKKICENLSSLYSDTADLIHKIIVEIEDEIERNSNKYENR